MPLLPRELVDAEHCVVTGVVGIVDRWSVEHAAGLAVGEIVGDRDRLAMRDQKSMERALQRRPGADPDGGTRSIEKDGAISPKRVAGAVRGKMSFMGAPPQFGRLPALAAEPFNRPGVDEFADALGHTCDLGVSLCDMNNLDAHAVRELGPAGPVGRDAG